MSTRTYDVAAQQLGAENAQLVLYGMFDFVGEPMFLHTGIGLHAWGGEDWLGVGVFGAIEPIRGNLDTRPSTFKVSLAPVVDTLLAEALYENTWGRLVELYLGTWKDDDTGFVNDRDPELQFRGRMGPIEVAFGARASAISVTIEDIRAGLDGANGLRATVLDHQREYPTDQFYSLLPKMMDHRFVFNGARHGSVHPWYDDPEAPFDTDV